MPTAMQAMDIYDQIKLQRIVDSLNKAVEMCGKVDYSVNESDPANIEKTAPHAVGYSMSAMRIAVEDLQRVLDNYC